MRQEGLCIKGYDEERGIGGGIGGEGNYRDE